MDIATFTADDTDYGSCGGVAFAESHSWSVVRFGHSAVVSVFSRARVYDEYLTDLMTDLLSWSVGLPCRGVPVNCCGSCGNPFFVPKLRAFRCGNCEIFENKLICSPLSFTGKC